VPGRQVVPYSRRRGGPARAALSACLPSSSAEHRAGIARPLLRLSADTGSPLSHELPRHLPDVVQDGWDRLRACIVVGMMGLACAAGSVTPAIAQDLPAPPKVVAADPEHALVKEALTVVDEHFIDLKNKKGVAASSLSHTFNGVKWLDLEAEADKKELKDRASSYKVITSALKQLGDKYKLSRSGNRYQARVTVPNAYMLWCQVIASALKQLGDKYTRFVKPEDFAKLTK